MLVQEIMEPCSTVCTEDTPIAKVYSLMRECDRDTVVVVENRAHPIPIGVVTEHLICEQLLGRGRNPRDLTAGNVMETHFHKVTAGIEADRAASLMTDDARPPVLVIDTDGEICGTLDRTVLDANTPGQRTESFVDKIPALFSQVGWTH
jgi:predicted transcriptional regulator